jgi:hypothetical protein
MPILVAPAILRTTTTSQSRGPNREANFPRPHARQGLNETQNPHAGQELDV